MAELLGHRMVDIDEDEELSYDWAPKLDGDEITESSWEIEPDDSPSPLLDDGTKGATTTSITISGLRFGVVYRLTNTIFTDTSRVLIQSFTIRGSRK